MYTQENGDSLPQTFSTHRVSMDMETVPQESLLTRVKKDYVEMRT